MSTEQLIEQLKTGNDIQRRSASYKLGKLKDTSIVPVLIEAYDDKDSIVRQNIAEALALTGSPEALDFLQSQGIIPIIRPKSLEIDQIKSYINNYFVSPATTWMTDPMRKQQAKQALSFISNKLSSSKTTEDLEIAENTIEIIYSPSRVNNYKTIKALGTVFYIGAGISAFLVVLSIAGIIAFATYPGSNPSPDLYIVALLSSIFLVTSLPTILIFIFLAESINVVLDIEANSRQTARTLERILRIQLPDEIETE